MQRLLGSSRRTWLIGSLGMLALLGPLSCGGGGGLSNELDAERAYLGLDEAVDGWLAQNPDADIEDDLKYIRIFIDNLRARGAEEPPPSQERPEPWPQD